MARPSAVLRSTQSERFERLQDRKVADMPRWMTPYWRMMSPAGASILITSAPWSASIMVATGPETMVVRSSTRMPSSGPGMAQTSGALRPP